MTSLNSVATKDTSDNKLGKNWGNYFKSINEEQEEKEDINTKKK